MEGRTFVAGRRGGLPKTLDFGCLPDTLEDCDEDEWKILFGVFLERYCLPQIEGIIEKADDTIHYGVTIRSVSLSIIFCLLSPLITVSLYAQFCGLHGDEHGGRAHAHQVPGAAAAALRQGHLGAAAQVDRGPAADRPQAQAVARQVPLPRAHHPPPRQRARAVEDQAAALV